MIQAMSNQTKIFKKEIVKQNSDVDWVLSYKSSADVNGVKRLQPLDTDMGFISLNGVLGRSSGYMNALLVIIHSINLTGSFNGVTRVRRFWGFGSFL